MKIQMIRSDVGLYISAEGGYSSSTFRGDNFRFNGGEVTAEPTWNTGWFLLRGIAEITSYEVKMKGGLVNPRWELKDKEDNPMELPEMVDKEESCEWVGDDEYYWSIGSESIVYKHRFYYERVQDQQPDFWEAVELDVVDKGVLSVDHVDNFKDMKVNLYTKQGFQSGSKELSLNGIARYSELDKMLTPPLAIHNRPCTLTSKQTYQIIRDHVKTNIDGKYASITSDYDFCFTVKKNIRIEPYTHTTEVKKRNGRSYARPRFNTKGVEYKQAALFEITSSEDKYKGCTVIDGFRGESLEDLATQIKVYLEDLMNTINAPLHECTNCSGMGTILQTIGTNER